MLLRLVEDQLFRSVEGQAASDEEEDRWTRPQQRKVDEVKMILTRLSSRAERYCPLHHHNPTHTSTDSISSYLSMDDLKEQSFI